MNKMEKNDRLEQQLGKAMSEYQSYIKELTGLDPRGGQIGPIEIYRVARKAAQDVYEEKQSKIITDINK